MIKHYTDHAANERTYLAWIRTSIAIMGFGFIIEKFEIYISQVGQSLENEKHLQASLSAELGRGVCMIRDDYFNAKLSLPVSQHRIP